VGDDDDNDDDDHEEDEEDDDDDDEEDDDDDDDDEEDATVVACGRARGPRLAHPIFALLPVLARAALVSVMLTRKRAAEGLQGRDNWLNRLNIGEIFAERCDSAKARSLMSQSVFQPIGAFRMTLLYLRARGASSSGVGRERVETTVNAMRTPPDSPDSLTHPRLIPGQKRLTNVAVVRYKKFGKRFEIAAYKNTVINWRNGLEKDLDEVLQSTTVFSNVSKGILAKREDMIQVFGTDDEEKICIKILQDGQLQVSDKERQVELENRVRDVAGILSEKCINPKSKKPYTIGVLERALKDIHFSADPKKPAKLQAVETLPLLQAQFPIERAQMQLRVVVPASSSQDFQALLARRRAVVTEQSIEGDDLVVECCIDPGAYRELNGFVADEGQRGRLDVVSLAAFSREEVEQEEKDEGVKENTAAAAAGNALGGTGLVAATEGMSIRDATGPLSPSTQLTASDHPAPGDAPSASASAPRPVVVRAKVEETVLYPRGPISGMPDEYAARRERFAEIDELQQGWTVELQTKGGCDEVLSAIFFGPAGDKVGSFAMARRRALAHSKC